MAKDQPLEDRRKLEQLVLRLRDAGEIEEADEIAAIAARIERPPVELVEQTTMGRKSPTIPDGWSWTDIGDQPGGGFTGRYSGIRLTKGEPFIEQCGHTLLVRQGDVSMGIRQAPIYEQISRAGVLVNGIFRPSVRVLVVLGFLGAREGFVDFVDGRQGSPQFGDATDITNHIRTWLDWTWENVIVPRKQPARPPRQPRLTDDPPKAA